MAKTHTTARKAIHTMTTTISTLNDLRAARDDSFDAYRAAGDACLAASNSLFAYYQSLSWNAYIVYVDALVAYNAAVAAAAAEVLS